MRVALLSDIHGNAVALDAVLSELRREHVDRVVCLGDVAATGPQPVQAIERIGSLDVPVIMGNTDAWLLDPQPFGTAGEVWQRFEDIDRWCAGQLSESDREYLRSFQPRLELELGERCRLLCFHGSPQSFDDVITATLSDGDLDRMLAGHRADLMAGGHTHIQMIRRHRDTIVLNTGSVGLAVDRVPPAGEIRNVNRAEYAVVEYADGRLSIDLRRTPFDLGSLTGAARDSGMPHAEWWTAGWKRADDDRSG